MCCFMICRSEVTVTKTTFLNPLHFLSLSLQIFTLSEFLINYGIFHPVKIINPNLSSLRTIFLFINQGMLVTTWSQLSRAELSSL